MKKKRNRTQTLDHSTVMRTIEASTNPELKMLWENFADISFVRDYRRKKKQPRKHRVETDEDFIELNFLAQAEQLGVAHARTEKDSAQFSGMQQ